MRISPQMTIGMRQLVSPIKGDVQLTGDKKYSGVVSIVPPRAAVPHFGPGKAWAAASGP